MSDDPTELLALNMINALKMDDIPENKKYFAQRLARRKELTVTSAHLDAAWAAQLRPIPASVLYTWEVARTAEEAVSQVCESRNAEMVLYEFTALESVYPRLAARLYEKVKTTPLSILYGAHETHEKCLSCIRVFGVLWQNRMLASEAYLDLVDMLVNDTLNLQTFSMRCLLELLDSASYRQGDPPSEFLLQLKVLLERLRVIHNSVDLDAESLLDELIFSHLVPLEREAVVLLDMPRKE